MRVLKNRQNQVRSQAQYIISISVQTQTAAQLCLGKFIQKKKKKKKREEEKSKMAPSGWKSLNTSVSESSDFISFIYR